MWLSWALVPPEAAWDEILGASCFEAFSGPECQVLEQVLKHEDTQ